MNPAHEDYLAMITTLAVGRGITTAKGVHEHILPVFAYVVEERGYRDADALWLTTAAFAASDTRGGSPMHHARVFCAAGGPGLATAPTTQI